MKYRNQTFHKIKSSAIVCLKKYAFVRKIHALVIKCRSRIAESGPFRHRMARQILQSSDEGFLKYINSFSYISAIAPEKRNRSPDSQDKKARQLLPDMISDTGKDTSYRVRALFAGMLYFKPNELPETAFFELMGKLGPGQILPAYLYIFNVFFPYGDRNEADSHSLFLRKAFLWLYADILASDPVAAEEKIRIFSQTYSGSVPISNSTNMKDIYEAERKILDLYTGLRYPGISEAAVSPKQPKQGKIRIGLLRYDYRGEIHFFLPLLHYMDSLKYEVHILAFSDNGLAEAEKAWPRLVHHQLKEDSLADSVTYIRNLGLDIIINTTSLSGRFDNPLAAVLGYRVAPVQMTCCANVTTSGIRNMDYFIIGERYLGPSLQEEMTEKILPCPGIGFYMPVPPETRESRVQKRAGLGVFPEDILFVSNAQMLKLTPDLLSCWLGILRQVPGSRLLLMPFSSDMIKARFGSFFMKMLYRLCDGYRVSRNRIIVAQAQGRDQTMAHLAAGDIYLDSFPYCGATSTTEALSLGIPVVTLQGSRYRSSLTAGLVRELDMDHAVAVTVEDYIARAVELAGSPRLRHSSGSEGREKLRAASFMDPASIAGQYDILFSSISGRKDPVPG